MQRLRICAAILTLAVAFTGCSPKTQREAGEAIEQTGETLESAGEDAVNMIEGVVEGASEAIEENEARP